MGVAWSCQKGLCERRLCMYKQELRDKLISKVFYQINKPMVFANLPKTSPADFFSPLHGRISIPSV